MLFIMRNGVPVRSNKRFSGDHPKSYRRDRHESLSQRAAIVRRVDNQLARLAIAEALEERVDAAYDGDAYDDHDVGDLLRDNVGPDISLIYDRRTRRLMAACAG